MKYHLLECINSQGSVFPDAIFGRLEHVLTLISRCGMSSRQNGLSGTSYGFTISFVRRDPLVPRMEDILDILF
jgi:hypothetical protein